jgi:hypothetical protein
MRYKLTVLLIVLNLALFSLIFYIDRVQSTRSVFESSSRLILDRSFVQGLDKIRIYSAANDKEWILQQSEESGWDVISPIHWKANPFAVQQLIFQLKSLSWESRFPVSDLEQAGQSLESYNLADPPLRIELSTGDASTTLDLGAPTEIGNRLYTMAPDGQFILVISKGIMDMLQRDMEAFLDRRIFGIGMEESRVIQIQDRSASNVRVRLERGDAGWNFVSPIEAEADGERVQAMISEWQSIDAAGFEMLSDTSLEMGGNTIQLTFEGLNERETLILAPPTGAGPEFPHYLAKRDTYDAVFKITSMQVEELRKAQEVLREKRVLARHADDWTSLEIQFGGLTTTLQQLENGAWQVLNTDSTGALNTQPADPASIELVKELLRTMEVVRFASDAPSENDMIRFGLDEPQRTITLRKASGQSIIFKIGGVSRDDESTLLYGNTNQSASVFVIRPHILAGIPLNPFHYRDRTVFTLPDTAELLEMKLMARESSETIPVDERTAELLKAYLKKVKVERYLNQPFADPVLIGGDQTMEWPYMLKAAVSYGSVSEEAPEAVEFYLSERLGGTTQYLGDPVSGLIGTLPIDVIERLDSFLVEFPDDPGEAPQEPVIQPDLQEDPAPEVTAELPESAPQTVPQP